MLLLSKIPILKVLQEELTTVKIYYFMPDHQHLVQEFCYQFLDVAPKFPRLQGFVDYWQEYIEGKIKEVEFKHSKVTNNTFQTARKFIKYNE